MSLDVLYQSIQTRIVDAADDDDVLESLSASDVSEAQMMSAGTFLELTYGDGIAASRMSRTTSRGATPMMVGANPLRLGLISTKTTDVFSKDASFLSIPGAASRKFLPRLSTLPQYPNVENVQIESDDSSHYAVIISMYEVYNDRIFDLLAGPSTSAAKTAAQKRRGLLFKSTEQSPDRKVVAGLRKIVCASLDEALLVLETGLIERRVAGTGSNAVSSRSHGFFSVEIKKRSERAALNSWKSTSFTIVDLAGKNSPISISSP